MRRAIILVLLLLGVQSILPLGDRVHDQGALLAFGFLILGAYTMGEIAAAVKLPQIVGYIAAGIVFGPDVLNTVNQNAIATLAPISSLAIALIAFLAGAELRIAEVRERGPTILRIMFAELGFAFVLIIIALLLLRPAIPFLQAVPPREVAALVLIFSAMAIVHSPAVTMAMLTETRAGGLVARTTLGVVLFSDVVVVLLFAIVVAAARALAPPTEFVSSPSFALVVWEIAGALLVGGLLGGAVVLATRFVEREIFIFAVMVALLGLVIARITHVESLLTLLVAGFVTQNVGTRGDDVRHAMERAAVPIFVVFFALAGAQIELVELAALWMVILPLVLVRMLGLWAGSRVGSAWAKAEPVVRQNVWLGLVSQAGVAIGLATIAAQIYPLRGGQMRTLFLGFLAVNQVIGPVLFRLALNRSGELASSKTELSPAAPD